MTRFPNLSSIFRGVGGYNKRDVCCCCVVWPQHCGPVARHPPDFALCSPTCHLENIRWWARGSLGGECGAITPPAPWTGNQQVGKWWKCAGGISHGTKEGRETISWLWWIFINGVIVNFLKWMKEKRLSSSLMYRLLMVSWFILNCGSLSPWPKAHALNQMWMLKTKERQGDEVIAIIHHLCPSICAGRSEDWFTFLRFFVCFTQKKMCPIC